MKRQANTIYRLPELFNKHPPQAIELHMVHLQPNEIAWTKESCDAVTEAWNIPEKNGRIGHAQAFVVLSLRNTIITNYIRIMEQVQVSDQPWMVSAIRDLLHKKYATYNESPYKHFEMIAKYNGNRLFFLILSVFISTHFWFYLCFYCLY